MGHDKGRIGHTYWVTLGHVCLHTTMQRVELIWGVRWTLIHVLMHVHILTIFGNRGLPDLPRNRSAQCNPLTK